MRETVIVEVVAGPNGRLPAELLAAAYRASRAGLVVLALNGVSRAAVDALLDPVVREVGAVHGVRYVDIRPGDVSFPAPGGVALAVAASEWFGAHCADRGVATTPVVTGLRVLRELATPGEGAPIAYERHLAEQPRRGRPSSYLRLDGAHDAGARSPA